MSAVLPTPAPQPSTEQLVAALASGLLPLLGPYGIAASALVPAAQGLVDIFTTHPNANYTLDDAVAVVTQGNADLAKLKADAAAAP
jgi:hypothetical protein